LNLPNKLTVLRVILILPIVVCFFLPGSVWAWLVTVLFLFAFVTDILDGKIARDRNLVTNFGKFMDPLADKAVSSAVLVMLVGEGLADPVCVILILLREFMVSGVRLSAAGQGRVVAANNWGKLKTGVMNVGIIVILALRSMNVSWIGPVSLAFMVASAALAALSGVIYLIQNRDVLREM